jgi:hypothetical protein
MALIYSWVCNCMGARVHSHPFPHPVHCLLSAYSPTPPLLPGANTHRRVTDGSDQPSEHPSPHRLRGPERCAGRGDAPLVLAVDQEAERLVGGGLCDGGAQTAVQTGQTLSRDLFAGDE